MPILGDLPLLGGLFRNASNSDIQKRLYVFVKAEIIRPDENLTAYHDLDRISKKNRQAFEKHEQEFQQHQTWPGVKSKVTTPKHVLEDE